MSRAPALHLVLVAVLLLALAPPAAAAASSGPTVSHSLFDPLWQWLQSLRAADGGYIDPLGFKARAMMPRIATPRTSAGGAPHRSIAGAAGFSIDSFGGGGVSSRSIPSSIAGRSAEQRSARR